MSPNCDLVCLPVRAVCLPRYRRNKRVQIPKRSVFWIKTQTTPKGPGQSPPVWQGSLPCSKAGEQSSLTLTNLLLHSLFPSVLQLPQGAWKLSDSWPASKSQFDLLKLNSLKSCSLVGIKSKEGFGEWQAEEQKVSHMLWPSVPGTVLHCQNICRSWTCGMNFCWPPLLQLSCSSSTPSTGLEKIS